MLENTNAPRRIEPATDASGAAAAATSSAAGLLGRAGLDAGGRARRLAFLGFDAGDAENLAALRAFGRDNVDAIVDDFYHHLMCFEETRRLLSSDQEIARLKGLQREYFLRMLDGDFGREYFESRLRVGAAHARIDLRPEWYLGTYFLYVRLLTTRLREHYREDVDTLLALLGSFFKVVFLDMGLAIDAYILNGYVDRTLAQEYRRMAEVAEHALAEKAELEQTKADLTGMIVHDLKGPLGGILAVTQLARRRSDAGDGMDRHFAQIQRSARDLMRMIENLLEIDQMREGSLELRLEPIDVEGMLSECAAEYRAAGEISGATIAVSADTAVPVFMADRWLLRRVLNNLVVNAIRHSGAGRIDLVVALVDDHLEVRVRDGGRGIPPEEQVGLFERSKRRRGAQREDTGLGLIFCKLAVERMGGAIAIQSGVGKGTTFVIRLPADASL
jgi:signal transduction histidine kinase